MFKLDNASHFAPLLLRSLITTTNWSALVFSGHRLLSTSGLLSLVSFYLSIPKTSSHVPCNCLF